MKGEIDYCSIITNPSLFKYPEEIKKDYLLNSKTSILGTLNVLETDRVKLKNSIMEQVRVAKTFKQVEDILMDQINAKYTFWSGSRLRTAIVEQWSVLQSNKVKSEKLQENAKKQLYLAYEQKSKEFDQMFSSVGQGGLKEIELSDTLYMTVCNNLYSELKDMEEDSLGEKLYQLRINQFKFMHCIMFPNKEVYETNTKYESVPSSKAKFCSEDFGFDSPREKYLSDLIGMLDSLSSRELKEYQERGKSDSRKKSIVFATEMAKSLAGSVNPTMVQDIEWVVEKIILLTRTDLAKEELMKIVLSKKGAQTQTLLAVKTSTPTGVEIPRQEDRYGAFGQK
jgi:hypothetical protein